MRPLVKICGITRVADAVTAAGHGAAAIGFLFWPRSPRCVDPARARAIVSALPPFVTAVGVFVDQPPDEVRDIAAHVGLGAVQLHGDEAVADYAGTAPHLIKAVSVSADRDVDAALARIPDDVTVLLDAHDPVRRGGTGRAIDWHRAAAVAVRRRTILSGGLTPDNIARAIRTVRPYAVDVSSGVETAPGIKAAPLLRALFANLDFEPQTTPSIPDPKPAP